MNSLLRATIKILLYLYTFIGKVIDILAIKVNGGVHPKHGLMRYYEFFTENVLPGDVILDIGCGYGFVASQVAKKVKKVTGIDTEQASILQAKQQHTRENIEYILGDATRYPFNERYNAIILSNVLEHIENRKMFLGKIAKLSDTLLIRVPMFNRDWFTLYKKSLGMFYFSDPTHFIEYTLESFQDEMAASGLRIESYTIRFGEIWAVVKTS